MGSTAEITVLATGGTIDKTYNTAGQLEIGPPAAQRLLDILTTTYASTCAPSLLRTASI
jgi:L-asparaginase/Glu-tRNA(Gln) amidotransferase subunit D